MFLVDFVRGRTDWVLQGLGRRLWWWGRRTTTGACTNVGKNQNDTSQKKRTGISDTGRAYFKLPLLEILSRKENTRPLSLDTSFSSRSMIDYAAIKFKTAAAVLL